MDSGPSTAPADPSQPLGGVTIDDPMPPQADALTDPAVADAAVRYAYQHWLLVDFDKDRRALLIENGERNRDVIDEGLKAARSIIEHGRIAVDEVTLTDAEHAVVAFRVQWQDRPSPYFPKPMTGDAVYVDGTWRIASGTLCLLAFGAGQDCAGAGAQNPTPPEALVLVATPPGFEWAGPPSPVHAIVIPGSGTWVDTRQQGHLTISADALAGVAALGPEDADLVLQTGRFAGEGGEPHSVAGMPARVIRDGTTVTLAYIRADDVVVVIRSEGVALEQVFALPGALIPAEITGEASGEVPGPTSVAMPSG